MLNRLVVVERHSVPKLKMRIYIYFYNEYKNIYLLINIY